MKNMGLVITKQNLETKNIFEQIYYKEIDKIIQMSKAEVKGTIYAYDYTKDYSNPDAKKI